MNLLEKYALEQIKASFPFKLHTKGFKKTVRDILKDIAENSREIEIDAIEQNVPKYLPDGYFFYKEKNKIGIPETYILCAIEVENQNPLSNRKLSEYGDFWFTLDCIRLPDYRFELMVFDRYGKNPRTIDLFDWVFPRGIIPNLS